jgi:hypothetical protein
VTWLQPLLLLVLLLLACLLPLLLRAADFTGLMALK